jgi:pSer/pThr/pTyr-binding forkhead associated (FHA) protein
MINRLSESRMHQIKWLLAVAWTVMIVSLFYDPVTPILTDPNSLASPFRLILDDPCIEVQKVCLPDIPYSMTARIFWAMIVPLGLILIFITGHELWRRICPLSFFSQIPRALGIQRKKKIVSESGKTRYQLFTVEKDSWLGKNHLYLQFAFFFLGLNIRILFVNSDRLALAGFLIFTILSAILVGYLFAGKSWCQYFCPMAPVQMVYTGPRGLLDSQSHLGDKSTITQSMCREVDKTTGQEKSACVACQNPCIDIDSESSYWEQIESPDRRLLYFGYLGLVIGFYYYYLIYSGNWEYYYSGAWTHEESQLATIFSPGVFIGGRAIPIPKIIASPLSLAAFAGVAYAIGRLGESLYRKYLSHTGKDIPNTQILHHVFTVCTFASWNIFWMFGSRPNLAVLPIWAERVFTGIIIIASGFWFAQTFGRTADQYQRESLSNALRRQLKKLGIDTSHFLQRGTDELKPDEVYVLAKVLPGFDRQSRLKVYQGVLEEALAEGKTQSANSLQMLQDVREELQVTQEEHYGILQSIGVENPNLLDPSVQRGREEQLRLTSYQRGMESLLMDLITSRVSIEDALKQKQSQIDDLRSQYRITAEEQDQVLLAMFHPDSALLGTSAVLLGKLQQGKMQQNALTSLPINPEAQVYQLLLSIIADRQKSIVNQLLNILELLANDPAAPEIARTTGMLAHSAVRELLQANNPQLSAQIRQILLSKSPTTAADAADRTVVEGLHETIVKDKILQITQIGSRAVPQIGLAETLQDLLQEVDPLTKAASLHALNQVEPNLPKHIIDRVDGSGEPLLQEIVDRVLQRPAVRPAVPTINLALNVNGDLQQLLYQQPTIRIGRSSDNDLVILNEQISRYHALLKVDETGIVVQDLESNYGLRLSNTNTRLHNGQQRVDNGTKIYFCSSDELFIQTSYSLTESKTSDQSITTLEKLLWLRSSPFFQPLNQQSLLSIARSSKLIIYSQGEVLCEQGKPAANLLMLISGTAQTMSQTIAAGQIVGETGILAKTAYPETVVATSPRVPTLVIAAESFDELLDREPQIARALLVSVSQRLQTTP